MLSWLHLNKKKPPEQKFPEEEVEVEKPAQAQITFSIVDGRVSIECLWTCSEDEELELSMDYGELISNINSGTYSEEIFKILNQFSKENETEKNFIDDTIAMWNEADETKRQDIENKLMKNIDEPVVHPLKVFRQSSMYKD